MGFSSSSQRYDITIALSKGVSWFELVSQVSDVAHGPSCYRDRKKRH